MSEVDPARVRLAQSVVWGALLASQAVYIAVLLSGVVRFPEEPQIPSIFPLVLAVVAMAATFVGHVRWRRASGAGRPLHAASLDPVTSFQYHLVAWVIDESIAVYAIVLAFLGFPVTVWAWFIAASALLLLVHRPRAAP